MEPVKLYCAGSTPASRHGVFLLARRNVHILAEPAAATHILLDVPSFSPDGKLRCGGNPAELLDSVPENATVIGGNLDHPLLQGRKTFDLLRDEEYLTQNAAITAHCALTVAASSLKTTFADTPTLIIGWGRIGKLLAKRLRTAGTPVTVAARNPKDLAMLRALGYRAAPLPQIPLEDMGMIINTVPSPVLTAKELSRCPRALKLDLASRRGLLSEDAIWARGLPAIHAPESAGALIAKTVFSLLKEETP